MRRRRPAGCDVRRCGWKCARTMLPQSAFTKRAAIARSGGAWRTTRIARMRSSTRSKSGCERPSGNRTGKADMADWVILVDSAKDFPNADTPHKVITCKEYLARSNLFRGSRPKIINLSRSFSYQSRGYYCSLLAEARGHRVIPSVETMVDLGRRSLYAQAVPELEDALARCLAAST